MGIRQTTYVMKPSEVTKKWYLIDAEGQILGRMSTVIANILRGKNNPAFTPHVDMGDNVIVINADKVQLTGNKLQDKEYFFHSQYPGGKRFINITKLMKGSPEFIIRHAVKGMLPKNRLGRKIIKNLKIYAGNVHPHASQQPEPLEIK